MPVLNECTFEGHLGSDPEMRYSQDGKPHTTFRMAVSNQTKNRETGGWEDDSMWIRVVVFGAFAESLGTQLHKGSHVVVHGRLDTPRIYTNKNGDLSVDINMVAMSVRSFDPRSSIDPRPGNGNGPARQQPAPARAPQAQPQRQAQPAGARISTPATGDSTLDEVPF